ncbi:hypothetical protein Anas_14103 [Armadillidium nasatum]|uniref:Uncharacterized protein n=1 Tax=Armadillidium nasatum TaxID=96803 RepID=A0A5N5T2M4_9CRUS|nr:hypothetical protein Anas_14103 [Armadillidium nasatum]
MNIRLVTNNNSNISTSQANAVQISGNQAVVKSFNVTSKPIAPAGNKNLKTNKTIPIQINQSPKAQRLLIPVSSSSQDSNLNTTTNNISGLQIRPQGSITLPASALPPGVLSNAQPGSLVMIPAQYFQNASNISNHIIQSSSQNLSSVSPQPPKSAPNKTVIDANVIKPRKPCNCTKSQCLKLVISVKFINIGLLRIKGTNAPCLTIFSFAETCCENTCIFQTKFRIIA